MAQADARRIRCEFLAEGGDLIVAYNVITGPAGQTTTTLQRLDLSGGSFASIWDEELTTTLDHIAISPDEQKIAAVVPESDDEQISRFHDAIVQMDLETKTVDWRLDLRSILDFGARVVELTYVSQTNQIVAATSEGVLLIDSATGQHDIWLQNRKVASAKISPDGMRLATSEFNFGSGTLSADNPRIWDLSTRANELLMDGHEQGGSVMFTEFLNGGDQLLTAGLDGMLYVWPTEPCLLPSIPTGVHASRGAGGTLNVRWNAAEHATQYRVYGASTDNVLLAQPITEWQTQQESRGISPGAIEYVWVRARNHCLESAFSTGARIGATGGEGEVEGEGGEGEGEGGPGAFSCPLLGSKEFDPHSFVSEWFVLGLSLLAMGLYGRGRR